MPCGRYRRGRWPYVAGPPRAEALAELVRERRRHVLSATEDALDVRVEERDGEPYYHLQGDLDNSDGAAAAAAHR